MNPAILPLIKVGLDALIQIWAAHTNKPHGWVPTAADWAELQRDVAASTPEAIAAEAKAFVVK